MRNLPIAATLILSLVLGGQSHSAAAQSSEHNRVGVERTDSFDISPSFELDLAEADGSGAQGLELDPSAGLECRFGNDLGLSVSMPGALWLSLGRDAVPRAVSAPGDPTVSADFSLRSGDWRFGLAASYRYPLGVWNPYEIKTLEVASGSGFHLLGLDFSATRFLDPAILSLRARFQTGLPKREAFGSSILPLVATLSTAATFALSDAIALSFGLDQRLASPLLSDGVPAKQGATYDLLANLAAVVVAGDDSVRIGLSKDLSTPTTPATFILAYSRTFRLKGTPR